MPPHQRLGVWREGSWVDRADKWVSHQLAFRWQLGLLEFPLAVPGTWFGTTTTSLGSTPLLIAAAADPTNAHLVVAASVAFCVALVIFGLVVAKRADRALLWWNPPVVVLASVGIAGALSPAVGLHASAFYVSCWGYSVLASSWLKTVFARRRPCITADGCERLDQLRLLPLHEHLCVGFTAIESFPSGDACGGAVASTALYLATGGTLWVVWLPMLLSAYGRMYIWAHHLLDVAAGAALGVATTLLVDRAVAWSTFGLLPLLVCIGVFALGRKGIVRLRPELPAELAAGKHYYG
jgi:membrane-associated phospholipid phosphatase